MTSGRSNAFRTAVYASVGVIPPTATPPTVTPAAIRCAVVDVVVVVVSVTVGSDAVQLALTARLDDAVREEDDALAGGERSPRLLVALPSLDAEREAARLERPHRAVTPDEPRRRMARARAGDLARRRVHDQVRHGDELPGRDLADDDVVCRREEIGRLRM